MSNATVSGTRAVLRHAHFSAYKAREVLDLIRGKAVGDAYGELMLCQRDPAQPIAKLLQSAVANAGHNDGLPPEELFVSACFADEGPTSRRFRPRARGRATRIRKRSCHITLIVSRFSLDELETRREASARSGRPSVDAASTRARRVAQSRKAVEADAAETTETVEEIENIESVDAAEAAVSEAAVSETAVSETAVSDDAPSEEVGSAETAGDVADASGSGMHLFAGNTGDAAGAADADADADAPYGPGSHAPLPDNAQPDGYPIKGNADSMLYHLPGGSHYGRTIAEVWFATEEDAERAGFAPTPSSAKKDEN